MNQFEKQIVNNNAKNKIPDRIFSPIKGVSLYESLFSKVFNNNIKFLRKIDVNGALYWFRKKAGKNAPGQPYRGHFEDNIKGQTAGLLLMGAGNALRWVKDPDLEKLVNGIVDEIKECSEDDGYLMAIPKEQFGTLEYPGYVRIWLTYGLYAAGLGGNQEALDILRRWQDWFNRCDDLPIIKYLTLAFQGVVASPFVYNTPIGKREDIDTTIQYYEEDWRLGQFIMREKQSIAIRKQPGYEPHPHGTELEALEGYLDLYRATGKHYYLRAVLNAYEMYKRDWQHAGGGIVMCEYLDSYPGCNWLSPPKPYNELCCSSFWIFLNQRLHHLFPENESYVTEIEKSLYNIAIANQDGDKGIRYFAWIDGHKQAGGLVHCCCGVGTRIYGLLPEFLYSVTGDDDESPALYIDLYNSSEFVWERKQGKVKIKTRTAMPYDEKIHIELECEEEQRFTLKLRIPSWVSGSVTVTIDGNRKITGQKGSYLSVENNWHGCHTVDFSLPFAWKLTKYHGAEEHQEEYYDVRTDPPAEHERWAYEYGPLLMSFCGVPPDRDFDSRADYKIFLNVESENYSAWMKKSDEPLHFKIDGSPYMVIPYFELGNDDPFTCYPYFHSRRK